jgi:hypothetical protein
MCRIAMEDPQPRRSRYVTRKLRDVELATLRPANLREWDADDLRAAVRAAGVLWQSTGGDDPHDVLTERQRELLDAASTAWRTAPRPEG